MCGGCELRRQSVWARAAAAAAAERVAACGECRGLAIEAVPTSPRIWRNAQPPPAAVGHACEAFERTATEHLVPVARSLDFTQTFLTALHPSPSSS
jgi:hypothetical protein